MYGQADGRDTEGNAAAVAGEGLIVNEETTTREELQQRQLNEKNQQPPARRRRRRRTPVRGKLGKKGRWLTLTSHD